MEMSPGCLGRSVQRSLRMDYITVIGLGPFMGSGPLAFLGYSRYNSNIMTYIYRVLREGPSGLWSMDSQPLNDSSGYGKNATFTGTPRTTRPIVAKGIGAQLIDSGDVISYPIGDIMIAKRQARSFSLEAWVKPTYGNTEILTRDNSGLFIDGLTLRFTVDLGTLYSVEYKNLNAGDIYHVTAVYDTQGIYMYLNGVKVAGADIDTPADFDDTAIKLSSSTSSSVVLDSLATYSYALPASVIAAHYKVGTDYPSVTTLSANNGGTRYDFIDANVGVLSKTAFPTSSPWTAGVTDAGVTVVGAQLVNLYSEADAEFQTGSWTIQQTFESAPGSTIASSRILWNASDPITVEKSEDGGTTWIPLTNGGQITSNTALTTGYTVSIRVTIPASFDQIAVEYLSVAFYSSLNVLGSDEDLPATIFNPAVTTVAEDHHPAASFNDNAGINFSGGSGGLSIPGDSTFGGYFAVEMTVRVDTGANSATILYVDAASAQPQITTDSTGKWTFSNLTALYVDGVSISSGSTMTTGEWHHVLAVFPESLYTVYVGNNAAGTAGYPMRIGHLATYSDPVTTTDAQLIYKAWVGAPSVSVDGGAAINISDGEARPMTMGLRGVAAPTILIPYSSSGWKYLSVPLSDSTDRSAKGFDDSSWATGSMPFGNGSGAGWSAYSTRWEAQTIMWARKQITLSADSALTLSYRLDNIIQVFVDGVSVFSAGGDQYVAQVNDAVTFNVSAGTHTIAIKFTDDTILYGGDGTYGNVQIEKKATVFKGYSHDWAIVSGG